MSLVIWILEVLSELGGLLGDALAAEKKGEPLRVDDVIPEGVRIKISKSIANARAIAKYGPDALEKARNPEE